MAESDVDDEVVIFVIKPQQENTLKHKHNVKHKHNINITHHCSHVRATFCIGIEEFSNRRRNLVSDESDTRFARYTTETGARKMESIYGICFWNG